MLLAVHAHCLHRRHRRSPGRPALRPGARLELLRARRRRRQRVLDAGFFATHRRRCHLGPARDRITIEPDVTVETIDIAPGDPGSTLYVGGAPRCGGRRGRLDQPDRDRPRVHQQGASYTATEIPLQLPLEFESSAFVSAVDPNDPHGSMYASANRPAPRRVPTSTGCLSATTAPRHFVLCTRRQALFPGSRSRATVRRSSSATPEKGCSSPPPPPWTRGRPTPLPRGPRPSSNASRGPGGNLYVHTPLAQEPLVGGGAHRLDDDDGLTFPPNVPFRLHRRAARLRPPGALASTCSPRAPEPAGRSSAPCSDGGFRSVDAEASRTPCTSMPDSRRRARGTLPRPRSSSCGCRSGRGRRRSRRPLGNRAPRRDGAAEGDANTGRRDQFGPRASCPACSR